VPIHLQGATKHLGYKQGDFPVVEQLAEIISLPIYPELGLDEVNYICQTIGDFLRTKRARKTRVSPAARGGVAA
jgi:dTDP-4-amino-4,6-dideoxygalactose transaminase